MVGSAQSRAQSYSLTPQVIAESLARLVASRNRVTACICGPYGSGKTTALALTAQAAFSHGLGLHEMAAFAPTWLTIRRLRFLVGQAWPDVDPQSDLFGAELSGVPASAMHGHTALAGDDCEIPLRAIERGFLDIIARINDISPERDDREAAFLESVRPRLAAAIRADLAARLQGVELPRNAYLDAIREYVASYKQENRLLDVADLAHGPYYTSPQVRLLLLDEVTREDQEILTRYFPNASIVTASRHRQSADVRLDLPTCLRCPQLIEITDSRPTPWLVPPLPEDLASLFVIAPPWRRGAWLAWLSGQGLPGPAGFTRWLGVVAAWNYDEDRCANARMINPLLRACGLPVIEDFFAAPGEIENWTDWRDMAGRVSLHLRTHAENVLARYGRLSHLPTVRLGHPARLRGIEAEVVILDATGNYDDDARAVALSRATRQLIVMQPNSCRSAQPGQPSLAILAGHAHPLSSPSTRGAQDHRPTPATLSSLRAAGSGHERR